MKQLSPETKMNFGGPSIETLRKRLPSYITDSGVLKYLNELYYQLTISESPEKPCPIIDKATLTVYPVALGNDGTALKPAIQLDERYKVNVGLKESVSLDFVQNNQYLSKDILQENLVCEALVSSVTSLDNKLSLPMAIYYVGKKGKTGENMMSLHRASSDYTNLSRVYHAFKAT